MKIAIYWEQASWGGVDTQLLTLLRTWPSSDDEFVLFYNRGNLGLSRIKDDLHRIPNVLLVEMQSFSYNEIVRRISKIPLRKLLHAAIYVLQPLFLFAMAQRISIHLRTFGPFDVLLSDNGGYPAAWGAQCAMIAASWAKVSTRFLLIHHSSTRPAPFMGWYERLVDLYIGRVASAIICVSYATRRSLLDCRALNDIDTRIRVIHNGIFPLTDHKIHPPTCDLRRTANANTELLVGMVGRVDPYKGHEDLIFAMARLREDERRRLKLVVIGSGDTQELERLRRLAVNLGIGNQLSLTGFVPGESVDIISQLDLLVIATRSFEGFGLTLAEALHAGTPILATRVGAIAEFVDELNGVLVNPGSPLEISLALRDFLGNHRTWIRRSEHGKVRIMAEGNRMADEYHRLFNECLAESRD